jgi:energy-coupling factor transporter ATP-binding protein EcfA2
MRKFEVDERWLIVGSTGSGKSTFGKFVMTNSPADMPWFFIDSKTDGLTEVPKTIDIHRATKLVNRRLLKIPRVNRVIFDDADEDAKEVWDDFCASILARGYCGLFIDESYMVPDTPNFRRLFTAGRSRQTPVIACSQRPISIPRVCVSEATRICAFDLTDERDMKVLQAVAPFDLEHVDPHFHKYYDGKSRETSLHSPIDNRNFVGTMASMKV